MLDDSLTITAAAPAPAPAAAAKPQPGFFHDLLSELNPLQYVPVVGTIYRAVTGDTIPETARFAGSLVVSGLTGGPVGVGINIGTTLLEHMLGIDPDKLMSGLLDDIGLGSSTPSAASASASAHAPADAASYPGALHPQAAPAPSLTGQGWSPAQLAAYGVRQDQQGLLSRGTDSGADVLNGLELAQIGGLPTHGGDSAQVAG